MAIKVSFKTARGRRVKFTAHKTKSKKTKAKLRARGHALAKKYGFKWKGGKLYRKSPRRGLIRVRN